MHEKRKAGFCVKQFVIFIKKQTGKSIKSLLLGEGQEYGIRELESWTKKKKIKVELTMAYSPEMNSIAERTNDLVAFKARCQLLNAPSKIGQSFWPEAFTIFISLLNRSLLSFLKYNYPLAVWLRTYNSSNESYIPNLGHLQTFKYQVYAKISYKKQIKSQKTTLVGDRKRYFMGYTSDSIYRVYFPHSRQIEIIQNLEFDKSYDNEKMSITEVEKLFFFFSNLELFINNTFTIPINNKKLFAFSVTYFI